MACKHWQGDARDAPPGAFSSDGLAGSGSEPWGPRPTPWPTAHRGAWRRRAGRGSSVLCTDLTLTPYAAAARCALRAAGCRGLRAAAAAARRCGGPGPRTLRSRTGAHASCLLVASSVPCEAQCAPVHMAPSWPGWLGGSWAAAHAFCVICSRRCSVVCRAGAVCKWGLCRASLLIVIMVDAGMHGEQQSNARPA
jgi:hypothetical protein